ETDGPRSAFRADPATWGTLLQLPPAGRGAASPRMPSWRFWSVAFSFLTAVIEWDDATQREGWSNYVMRSRARDVFEAHRRRLRFLDPSLGGGMDALTP